MASRRLTALPVFLFVCCVAARAGVRLPARFEPHQDGYLARTASGTYFLAPSGALRVSPQLEMRLVGANQAPRSEAVDELPGKSNYLIGDDPTKWRIGVPMYGRVRFERVYPGVDLDYHGLASDIEYDLRLAPYASPRRIVLEFSGADEVRLDRDGGLIVIAGERQLRFHPPAISSDGKAVSGGYRLMGGHRVGFRIGSYDTRRPLLIDPVLSYSAIWGTQVVGPGISAMALDPAGNIYIAGVTLTAIPLVNPIQPALGTGNCPGFLSETGPCQDIFVAELDPTGTQIVYSTYIGDNGYDELDGLAVDSQGAVYIAATSYPAASYFSNPTTGGNGFVRKLSPDGSALLYSVSLVSNTQPSGIALDSSGNALITGTSATSSFPTTAGAIQPQTVVKSMFVTNAFGATWNAVQTGAQDVYSLAIPPGQSSTLYAGTSLGIQKSVNGGANWSTLISSPDGALVVIDPNTPTTLYATYVDPNGPGTPGLPVPINRLARSTDAGATWTVISGGLPGPVGLPIGGVATDPENSSTVWAGTAGGGSNSIFKSTNSGATWTVVYGGPAPPPELLIASTILVDPTNSSHVYVCCIDASPTGLYITQDGGATWTAAPGPMIAPGGQFTPVLDPSNPNTLYAVLEGSLIRSTDGGMSWRSLLPSASGIGSLLIDPSSHVIFADTGTGHLLSSGDGGNTWTTQGCPVDSYLIALDPSQPGTLYLGAAANQVQDAFAMKLDASGSTVWATLLGGSGADGGNTIAVDAQGNAYVTGATASYDFPLANALQTSLGNGAGAPSNAFAAEISADGSKLIYSTYLGGSGADGGGGIAVDANGNAWVAGQTQSTNFPLANPIQSAPPAQLPSAFVAEIAAGGSKLLFSTYIPGSAAASGGVVIDGKGDAWIGGGGAYGLPLVDPVQPSYRGPGLLLAASLAGSAGFVVEFAPNDSIVFSTYFDEVIRSLAITGGGSAWLAGTACDVNFPNVGSTEAPPASCGGYLARIDPAPPPAQPGIPQIYGIYNAASYEVGDVVAPGEIVTILGAGLAPGAQSASGAPLPVSLNGVSVSIGGTSAPLYYVSPNQINLQVPTSLSQGAANLVLNVNGQTLTLGVRVIALRPGIFAVAHASDFSLVTAQNPAHAGEYLAVFCTGLGPTNPSVPAGQPNPLAPVSLQSAPIVEVEPDSVSPSYAGLAPGTIGLYQVNVQVPPGMTGTTYLQIILESQGDTNFVPLYVQ